MGRGVSNLNPWGQAQKLSSDVEVIGNKTHFREQWKGGRDRGVAGVIVGIYKLLTLTCARHCFKHLTYLSSFNNPCKEGSIIHPF